MIDEIGMDWREGPDPPGVDKPFMIPVPLPMPPTQEELAQGHLREQMWRPENLFADTILKEGAQPLCTRCKGMPTMQRRYAKKGCHFWGCPNFPRCTFTRRPHERRQSMTPVHKAPPPGGALPVPKAQTAQSLPPGLVGAAPAARPPPARQSPSSSMQTDGATPQPKRSTVQSPARIGKSVPPPNLIGFNLPMSTQEA